MCSGVTIRDNLIQIETTYYRNIGENQRKIFNNF